MTNYETIRYEVEGNLATIILNRPDNLNGIVNQMMRELYECLQHVAADPEIRVVLLNGAGKGFSPGVDLKAITSGLKQESNRKKYFHITTLLHEMPKVTIAGINGACAGAGFGWACACDLRYATHRASLNSAFLGVVISGDVARPWLLPRIFGAGKARELFFMSEKFKATEAQRVGLVNKVFSDDTFRHEVKAIAQRLSESAPLAIGEMKKNFVNAEGMPLHEYIELETERHSRIGESEDTKEAFKAFVEKRAAVFKGR